MFLNTGHLMNDIWFSIIYFRDFDDRESQKVGLSHGSLIYYRFQTKEDLSQDLS